MLTKPQILSAIRSAARKLGHAPTRAEFMRLSGIHYCRLIPHFPGYRAAVRAAGLSPHPNGVRIETSAMLQDWGKLARKKGRVPTRDEYEREGRYASASLETRFHRRSQIPAAFLKVAGSTGPRRRMVRRDGKNPYRAHAYPWRRTPLAQEKSARKGPAVAAATGPATSHRCCLRPA